MGLNWVDSSQVNSSSTFLYFCGKYSPSKNLHGGKLYESIFFKQFRLSRATEILFGKLH